MRLFTYLTFLGHQAFIGGSRAISRIMPRNGPTSGTPETLPEEIGDISGLHRHLQAIEEIRCLDRQTWSDLDGDFLCHLIAGSGSLFAQHVAYDRLNGRVTRSMTDTAAASVAEFLNDPDTIDRVLRGALPLKRASSNAVEMLFNFPLDRPFRWEWIARLLPVIFIAGAIALFSSTAAGALLLGLFGAGVFFVQSQLYAEMETLSRLEDEVRRLLSVVLDVSSSVESDIHPLLNRVRNQAAEARLLFKAIKRSRALSGLPEAEEYANWLLLRNIRRYLRIRPILQAHLPFLRTCFEVIGELELSALLAHELRDRPSAFCWVAWTNELELSLREMRHPVLSGATPISFCLAANASMPYLPVYTSLQIKDHLQRGDSLFAAEVARAHEMWQAAASHPGVFLIDEIFRGTNYTESVSAAIGLLEGLADRGLVIATTHNVTLASLLKTKFVFLIATRSSGAQAGRFELKTGVLEETNALKILGESDFGAGMLNRVAEVKAAISAPGTPDKDRAASPNTDELANR